MNKSDVSLERMRTFVRVVERANFSQVARELGVAQPSVTRHLKELEMALGVSLLKRTTRQIAITEEGQRYYQRCLQILRLVDDAGAEVSSNSHTLKGKVKLSCTSAFGILHLCPLLYEFQDQYPEIEVEANLTDEKIDLVKEGVDFTIRLASLNDSSLKCRKLGGSERLLVASPAFLSKHSNIKKPQDLQQLEAIKMGMVIDSNNVRLISLSGEGQNVKLSGRILFDHGLAAKSALQAGRGFGVTHRWLIDDLLESGELIRLLPDYQLTVTPLSLLIAPERADIARVRCLIDFLIERIRLIPGIL